MNIKRKRGQSTVEYVLLMTAVVAVIIALVTGNKSGLQSQLNSTLNASLVEMNSMGDSLASSHVQSNGSLGSTTPPVTVDVTNGLQGG